MCRDKTEGLIYICTYVTATAVNCGYTKLQLLLASHCTQYKFKGTVQRLEEEVSLYHAGDLMRKSMPHILFFTNEAKYKKR